MSHFSVLVFTKGKPTHEELSAILAPWHEFECTGHDNEYVQDIDETKEKLADFAEDYERRLRALDGSLHDPYDDCFYREPTSEEANHIIGGAGTYGDLSYHSKDWGDGRGYRAKIRFIPVGWEEVKIPSSELMSFRDWLEGETGRKTILQDEKPDLNGAHKFGYTVVSSAGEIIKTIGRTNQNAKWDWWKIGGRYSGKLGTYDPEKDERNYKFCWLCGGTGTRDDELGREARANNPDYTCNGCNGTGKELVWPSEWPNIDNQAELATLDWATLKERQVSLRRRWWNELKVAYDKNPAPGLTFEEARKEWAILIGHARIAKESGDGRPLYKIIDDDPRAKDLRKADGGFMYRIPDDATDCETWAQAARPLTTFAIVKDGKWFEQGEMGWWGVVHDKKDQDTWDAEVEALLKNSAPGTWVTAVDCHI